MGPGGNDLAGDGPSVDGTFRATVPFRTRPCEHPPRHFRVDDGFVAGFTSVTVRAHDSRGPGLRKL